MAETYAGMLARTLPEMERRELSALAAENHWHEEPNRWPEENRRSALCAIRIRAEDASVPELFR